MTLLPELLTIATFLAQAAEDETAPLWANMIPFILLIAVFYFVLIRPQQVMKRKQEALISEAKSGDRVTTNGGILGVVTNVRDTTFLVRIADNVKIEVLKSAIASVEKNEGKKNAAPVEDEADDNGEDVDGQGEVAARSADERAVPRNRSKKKRR